MKRIILLLTVLMFSFNTQALTETSNEETVENHVTVDSNESELSQLNVLLNIKKIVFKKVYAGGVVYCSLSNGDYVWRDNNGHFYYMQRVTNTAGTVYLPTDLGSGIQGSAAAAVRCANQ